MLGDDIGTIVLPPLSLRRRRQVRLQLIIYATASPPLQLVAPPGKQTVCSLSVLLSSPRTISTASSTSVLQPVHWGPSDQHRSQRGAVQKIRLVNARRCHQGCWQVPAWRCGRAERSRWVCGGPWTCQLRGIRLCKARRQVGKGHRTYPRVARVSPPLLNFRLCLSQSRTTN